MVLGRLRCAGAPLLEDYGVLAEFMDFADAVFANRGLGSQIAASDFSMTLNGLVIDIDGALRDGEARGWAPPAAKLRKFGGVGEEVLLNALAAIQEQALHMALGQPSRSYHAGRLRAAAWFRLGHCWAYNGDPEIISAAIKVATRRGGDSRERGAAIDFLGSTAYEDGTEERVVEALEAVVADPPDRITLVGAMQALIQLGEADGFSTLCELDNWDQTHGRD